MPSLVQQAVHASKVFGGLCFVPSAVAFRVELRKQPGSQARADRYRVRRGAISLGLADGSAANALPTR